MATAQSSEDIAALLVRLVGEEVHELQVLGINSLKSLTPSPADLAGRLITAAAVADRIVTIDVGGIRTKIDLQRTGRLVWLNAAVPAKFGAPSLPTIRLILASGAGLDFTEPAKTKRISVTILQE